MSENKPEMNKHAFEALSIEFAKLKWREEGLNWKAERMKDWQPEDEERWLVFRP